MSGTFMDQLEYVTVAVAFDRHTIGLTRAAAELAQRTGKKLCLLHVVEPWAELPVSRPFGGDGDPLWDVTQAVESNARDLAEGRLEELASFAPAGVAVKRAVVSGKPLEVLGREALGTGSCLLVVGADFTNVRFLPRGFSTALSLLVSSPVPVCVFDPGVATSLVAETTRILLADDLGPQSETAIEFAAGLATALGKSELHHVHVNGLTYEALVAGLETAAAAAHTPIAPGATAAEVYDALIDGLKEKLDLRASAQRDYLDAAGSLYVPEVVTGNVESEIADVAAALAPQLLVFGRHHAYYTKPFFLGRLPYRAMLAQRRPVIVVPNE